MMVRPKTEGAFYGGSKVEELRKMVGMSRQEFAKALGVSSTLVTYIEGNRRRVTQDFFDRLRDKFNISDDYFMGE